MKIFERVNGRWSITGSPVRVDVRTKDRLGRESVETVLSNGKTVGLVYKDGFLRILTGKGAHTMIARPDTVLHFYVNGELVAEVDSEWAKEFDFIPEPTA